MKVGVVGLSFKTADLTLRDQAARAALKLREEGAVILSTCNRTEIYYTAEDLAERESRLLTFFEEGAGCRFRDVFYCFQGIDCLSHLCRVVSGLDSAIIGETEIQHQVKCAYREHCKIPLPSAIHFLFQKALKIGKTLRSALPNVRGIATLEALLWDLVREHHLDASRSRALFVGDSEINRSLIRYFMAKGFSEIGLCTRYPREDVHCTVLGFEALASWDEYDLVISASKTSECLIRPKGAFANRRRLIVDLSVPLTIHPSVGQIPGVSFYNMEEINRRLALMQEVQKALSASGEQLLSEQVERLCRGYSGRYSRASV